MKKADRPFLWKNRERDLKAVKRYHKLEVMFYRTDLLIHSERVPRIVQALLPHARSCYPSLDGELAFLISRFHDDPEMLTGAVPLQLKLLMDESAHLHLKQQEIEVIDLLARSYGNPKIKGYRYEDLLMHAALKDCREAQVHSFADKVDGYCEALHEVLAGNMAFIQPVMNYLLKTFNDPPGHFPLIKDVFASNDSFFHFPVVNLAPYFKEGRVGAFPHTPGSITQYGTGVLHYELWKALTLTLSNGMERLTKQVEFFP